MTAESEEALAEVALADAPPGAVIIGLSIARDERRGATLTFLPGANYLMDDVFEFVDGSWQNREGGSGGPGINWTGDDVGVLRFSGEAPDGVQTAVVKYSGVEHRVPVRHGHFLFVSWTRPSRTIPN
ncbi:MAG: hypothetical protein ACRDQ1_20375 [Sciscionella sp.]